MYALKCRDLGTVSDGVLLFKRIKSKNPFELHHDTTQCSALKSGKKVPLDRNSEISFLVSEKI